MKYDYKLVILRQTQKSVVLCDYTHIRARQMNENKCWRIIVHEKGMK